jgi:glycosyltransferase involved in cell wall biosynthesis
VLFAGPTDDVAPYLQAADLFVLPSVAEGLSNALLEAMASDLPTIATNVGGAYDLIEHGCNGLLIPPDSPPALQEAILMVLDDQQYRTGLSRRSREKVVQNYTLPLVAKQLQTLYDQLIANRPAHLN